MQAAVFVTLLAGNCELPQLEQASVWVLIMVVKELAALLGYLQNITT
jgi:hypothetical protein